FGAQAGHLVIESEPSGADVSLDGRYLGTTPLSLTSVTGERLLRFDAHGTSRTMKVVVTDGQITHTRVDFVGVPSAHDAAIGEPVIGTGKVTPAVLRRAEPRARRP